MTEVYELDSFCQDLERLIAEEEGTATLLAEAQSLLKKLLPNEDFARDALERMICDTAFIKSKISTIDRQDIMLRRSPRGSFSLRLFVWMPGAWHPIHDHGAWGVIGGYVNTTEEVRYSRLDDGSIEGHARIEEKSRRILRPGDTTAMLPFDRGIHWTGCAGDRMSLTVHIYGKPLRRGFIRCFDPEKGTIYPLITPKIEKRLYALRAMGLVGGEIARAVLEKSFHDTNPLIRWESLMMMKQVDDGAWSALVEEALDDRDEDIRRRARNILDSAPESD